MNVITVNNPPISALASAANTFSNGSALTKDFEVFPTSYIITPYTEIYYRYKSLVTGQKPINTSLLAANIIASPYNCTCPAKANGVKPTPFPFSLFVQNNAALEKQIREVHTDAIASTDPAEILSYLYTQQSDLINNIVSYYQYMSSDTTVGGNYTDSIARVYEQVGTNYEYQIYRASAYWDLGRYDDATTLLNSLAGLYQLDDDETQQVSHIVDMYKATLWLQQNNGSWDRLPGIMKDQVYQYESEDLMFAGAIARSLLSQYEARSYDPVYIAPEDIDAPMSYKVKSGSVNNIYPNPATDHLLVSYTGDKAVLVFTDMMGKEVLRQSLNSSHTVVNIEGLHAGMYYATIWSDNTIQYQQKVVKQ